MKSLIDLLKLKKENKAKTLEDYQRELLVKLGRKEFQKLTEMGITVPVALG